MMNIAEIRKKAKGKPPVEAPVAATSLPPAPMADVPMATGTDWAVDLVPSAETGLVPAMSGLDRLFAGTIGMQLATDEAYQNALASQDLQEEVEFSQYLAFQLGSEEYALDINRISEIIKPREYTDIPLVPEFILGLISLRGVVVPVFDLRRRFGLGECQLGSASRIVVCREGEVTVGLLVDSINQVIRLAGDRIEPPPAVLSGVDRSLVVGVGRYQGRMIILLNLSSVLDVGMS
jgi:purine-binding chemotaxis protein CheW